MKFFKTRFLPLILLLVFLVTYNVTALANGSDPALWFTDNLTHTQTEPSITPMEQALLTEIHSATQSIDAAFYDFNRDSIRDALIAAHNRGVFVRIITDDEARHHIASYIPYYLALENAGIPLKDDEREGSIMHNKYFIFDSSAVWTGSANMSDNGFTLNHNNGLLLQGSQIAALYQYDFDQMWSGLFSVHKSLSPITTITYNGLPLSVYFSPEDEAMNEMLTVVNNAEHTIDFTIFFFTNDDLRDALIAAHQRGVQIRANSEYGSNCATSSLSIASGNRTTVVSAKRGGDRPHF